MPILPHLSVPFALVALGHLVLAGQVPAAVEAPNDAALAGLEGSLDERSHQTTSPTPTPPALVKTVADAVLRDFPAPPPFDWGEGVLLTGMMHAHRLTGDPRYLDLVRRFADHWAERGLEPILAAKGYCGHWGPAFPLWLLYEVTRDERHARLAEQVIDFMLRRAERTRDGALSHFYGKVQLWVDTLDMVCPVLAHGSRLRRQPAWQAEAVRQYDLFAQRLQDPQTRLWVHLWDEATGEKTTPFWARGNGWVVLSLVEMLKNEPPDSPTAQRLRQSLTELLAALVKLQDPTSGLWHTVLDAPDTPLETSASAMFLYGLAESRRLKLAWQAPEEVLRRAWAGLARQVDAQGRVVGVSAGTIPGDKARYATRPMGTHPWGTGAFLMAAVALAERETAPPRAEAISNQPVRLRVDFTKPAGTWNMPALALGQGGLQSDPMIEPHIKELRPLRPQTIRLFLSEYYRIYPARDTYDWTKLDRELRAVRATGARPVLALAMKPPALYPKVDHFLVHPSDYAAWERLCEALARHCREAGFDVAAWEVCNEPDIGESGGTPHYFRNAADYNRFYTHTVAGLRRGDPQAQVGGPAVASADSFLVEGLIAYCATSNVPLHFLSWHLYSDSPAAHAANLAKQRARLAKYPQLSGVKLFVSEWNMDLMRPNLAPGFQPCFVLETMRRFAEAGLDMAAYYHIRDCFVDPADFDWMSPGGRRFMAHWWNVMPQYSALFDHHGRVRPVWYAFRMLGQLAGPRYAVEGERDGLRALAGEGDGYKHLLVWRFEAGGPEEIEVQLDLAGVQGRPSRVVRLDAAAPVNQLQVLHFGRAESLRQVPLRLKPWDIRWIEIE